MAVADAWALQQAVYSAVRGALDAAGETGLPIYDHVPTQPADEFVRLEGFDAADDSFKDTERARHPVHVTFIAHNATRGQARVHALMAVIHAALRDLRVGRGRMQFEYLDVESADDLAGDRGTLRYTIVI